MHGASRHRAARPERHAAAGRHRAVVLLIAVLAVISGVTAALGTGPGAPSALRPLASAGPSASGTPTGVPSASPSPPACTVSAILVPSCGAWWGVAPASWTDEPRLQATHEFETEAGRRMAVVHTYHRGGLFPTADEIAVAREPGKHRLLYINWKPESGHTWAQVAAGAVDAGIDREADYLKERFPERFFLAIHHEPENEVDETTGSGFTAADYHDMFRHVVERLRSDGVSNAIFVMNYMAAEKWMVRPWFDQLYPGDDVVDWIAFDRYASAGPHFPRLLFSDLIDRPVGDQPGFYTWARENHPDKPLALGEWGVYCDGDSGDSADFKTEFFTEMQSAVAAFPDLRMYLYFDAPHEPRHGNSTITTTPQAQAAFRKLSSLPLFAQLPS